MGPSRQSALKRVRDFLIEDILATSDEEILAEEREDKMARLSAKIDLEAHVSQKVYDQVYNIWMVDREEAMCLCLAYMNSLNCMLAGAAPNEAEYLKVMQGLYSQTTKRGIDLIRGRK